MTRTIQNFINDNIGFHQTDLVNHLLDEEFFIIDEIENLYVNYNENIDPENRNYEHKDIFQWFPISDWIADRFLEKKEVILKNDYGTWWGRTTYGQPIEQDSVIQQIFEGK